MISPRRKSPGRDTNRNSASFVPPMRLSEEDLAELREPEYDLGGPDYPEHWLPGPPRHPDYWVVLAQHPDLPPDQPSMLDKLLGTAPTRSHYPEPDLEAEP